MESVRRLPRWCATVPNAAATHQWQWGDAAPRLDTQFPPRWRSVDTWQSAAPQLCAVTILYNSDIISTMSHSSRCCRWRWWSPAGRARCAVQARGRGRGRSGGQPSRWGRTWGHLRSPEVTCSYPHLDSGEVAQREEQRRGRQSGHQQTGVGGEVARWPGAKLFINLFVFPGGEEGARPGGINIYIITVTLCPGICVSNVLLAVLVTWLQLHLCNYSTYSRQHSTSPWAALTQHWAQSDLIHNFI